MSTVFRVEKHCLRIFTHVESTNYYEFDNDRVSGQLADH